jgi:hypothetical protein
LNTLMANMKWTVNLFRRRKYWARSNCIFIHVPKAAGTSINTALYGRTLGHYSALEIRNTFPNLYERAFKFSLVRNPWDRLLSAYRFAKQGGTDSMGVYMPEQYELPEFDTFERFINDWLPHQSLMSIDFIFRPQYIFVCDANGQMMLDFLGKTETIESDLLKVSSKIGRGIAAGKTNSTNNTMSDYRFAYKNSRMVDLVYALYREDVDKFDYQFE